MHTYRNSIKISNGRCTLTMAASRRQRRCSSRSRFPRRTSMKNSKHSRSSFIRVSGWHRTRSTGWCSLDRHSRETLRISLAVLNDEFLGDFDVDQQVPKLDQGSKSGWSLDFEALAYDLNPAGWQTWTKANQLSAGRFFGCRCWPMTLSGRPNR